MLVNGRQSSDQSLAATVGDTPGVALMRAARDVVVAANVRVVQPRRSLPTRMPGCRPSRLSSAGPVQLRLAREGALRDKDGSSDPRSGGVGKANGLRKPAVGRRRRVPVAIRTNEYGSDASALSAGTAGPSIPDWAPFERSEKPGRPSVRNRLRRGRAKGEMGIEGDSIGSHGSVCRSRSAC